MDFPHLQDSSFPDVGNVNVYKYKNNFDYARWHGKVSYKLLNVKWNSVYNDVPYFDTVKKRDAWFDSQEGYIDALETVFNNTPKTTLKVPLPYNDAYHYNYLVVDMPMQTSENEPLNYANDTMRVKRWFYFIEDMTQLSPSTTELKLSIDYWVTFINTVSIPYLMLERGHAPMMKTKVSDYLSNPIENNEYLLADDFNYGKEMSQVATSNYIPIGNGKKFVLFAVPFAQADFENLGGSVYSGNSTPPSFADTTERWGYQIIVNDYDWKYGTTDYSNANLPIKSGIAQENKVLNGTYVYAIDSADAIDFFNDMAHRYVNFMHAVQCVFILDENMFTNGSSFTYNGYTLYNVSMKANTQNINLSKAMFDYDAKYADIAKLYTSPYSYLEFTDDNGNSFDMRIELCGNLQLHNEISIIFPYLRYNVFLSGVNGNNTTNYIWKNLNDANVNKTIWGDDFSKFMMNWDIPTYSVFISAENEYAANNAAGIKARREGAIIDYRNAARYANTTRANTADSMQTSTDNVNANTTTDVANTAATGTMQNENAALDNARDLANKNTRNATNIILEGIQLANMWADNARANYIIGQSIGTNVDNFAATSIASGINNLVGPGGGVDFIGSTIAQAATLANDATMQNNIAAFEQAQMQSIYAPNFSDTQNRIRTQNTDILTADNFAREETTENTVDTNNANAARSKATGDANALRTQNTETANAGYTRNANIVAEQDNLRQKQRETEAQYRNARLQKPIQHAQYSGDAFPDIWQRRGIRLNVRTQSKSAIAQAGDAMLRFGYALHRAWDMADGFHYGKNFTYWKAEDIWINDGEGAANAATNAIANILLEGVTVWRNPSIIGTIGIYDNI